MLVLKGERHVPARKVGGVLLYANLSKRTTCLPPKPTTFSILAEVHSVPGFHTHKRGMTVSTSFTKGSEVPLRALCKSQIMVPL